MGKTGQVRSAGVWDLSKWSSNHSQGKKTIAKLYAQFLHSLGAVKSDKFGRTSMAAGDTSAMFKNEKPTVSSSSCSVAVLQEA
jgi:hypothetical protein